MKPVPIEPFTSSIVTSPGNGIVHPNMTVWQPLMEREIKLIKTHVKAEATLVMTNMFVTVFTTISGLKRKKVAPPMITAKEGGER